MNPSNSSSDCTTGAAFPHTAAAVLIGKYRVSSMPQSLADGRFGAGVSIRSGTGSASTDRVLRFKGSFATEAAAHRYAHDQGRQWVRETGGAR